MADSEAILATQEPGLQHHFDDSAQQLESSTLGMWVFLVTEVMFFGGMFGAYTVYRNMYPEAFASTSHFMNVTIGAINTGVLIFSSFTMVLAVRSAQLGQKKALIAFLVLTLILGCVFLSLKYVEYHEKWVDHHIPGPGFQYADSRYVHQAQILFYLYFAMTGMHAIHMIVGAGLLITLIVMAARNRFSSSVVYPSRDDRPLLALRRYRLDFPLPASVLNRTHKMTHQAVPVKVYAAVFGALLVLTITTVAVSKLELGEYNFIVAMTIAVIKGTLVVMFFMDVRRASSMTKLFIGAGFFWLAILLVFLLSDYLSRGWLLNIHWL